MGIPFLSRLMRPLVCARCILGKDNDLLRQFVSNIRTQLDYLANDPEKTERATKIRGLIENEPGWLETYEAEQLLMAILPDTAVEIEIQRRLADADKSLPPALAELYKSLSEKTVSICERRALLARMLNDLQWNAQKKQEAWKSLLSAALKLLLISIVTLICFGGTVWLYDTKLLGAVTPILLALFSGVIGAILSLAIRMNGKFDQDKARHVEYFSYTPYLLLRSCIGGMAAICGYFLAMGKIFAIPALYTDSSYTELTMIGIITIGVLLGFSEALVPNILNNNNHQ